MSEGRPVPTTWSLPGKTGIKWQAQIAGLGHSSPIIWGDSLCVTTAISGRADAGLKPGPVRRRRLRQRRHAAHVEAGLSEQTERSASRSNARSNSGVPKSNATRRRATRRPRWPPTAPTSSRCWVPKDCMLRQGGETALEEGFGRPRFRLVLRRRSGASAVRRSSIRARPFFRATSAGRVPGRVRRRQGSGALGATNSLLGHADGRGERPAAELVNGWKHFALTTSDRQGNVEVGRRRRHPRADADPRRWPDLCHQRHRPMEPIYAIRTRRPGISR